MSCKRILCPSYLLESWQGCDFVEISTYFLCSNIPIVQAGVGECFPFFRIVVADKLANVETIHKFIVSALHVILLDAVQKLGLKDKQICVFVLSLGIICFMLWYIPLDYSHSRASPDAAPRSQLCRPGCWGHPLTSPRSNDRSD